MSEYDDYLASLQGTQKDEYQQYLDSLNQQQSPARTLLPDESFSTALAQSKSMIQPYQQLAQKTASIPYEAVTSIPNYLATSISNTLQGRPQEPSVQNPMEFLNKYGTVATPISTIPGATTPIQNLGGLTPSQIISPAADVALGAGMMGAAQGPIDEMGNTLSQAAEKNRIDTMARTAKGFPVDSDSANFFNRGGYNKVLDTLDKYGLADLTSNPAKLEETISGTVTPVYDQYGRLKYDRDPLNPGLIDNLGRQVGQLADQLDQSGHTVSTDDMINAIFNKQANRAAEQNTLAPYQDEDKLYNRIVSIFGNQPEENSIKDLIDMKRNASDRIYEINRGKVSLPVEGATDLSTYHDTRNFIDDYINSLADKQVPGASQLIEKNNDLSNIYHARELVRGSALAERIAPTQLEALYGVAVSKQTGMPTVGTRAERNIMEAQRLKIPAMIGNIQQSAANVIHGGAYAPPEQFPSQVAVPYQAPTPDMIQRQSLLSPATGAASGLAATQQSQQSQQPPAPLNTQGRFPQSAPTTQQQLMMRKGLVENLAEFQIPRNSQDILNNRQLVLAKIAQATNNPKIVDGLQDTLNMHPDMLKHALPALVLQFPNLFQPDYYNRVDGKIFSPDPMQKQQMIQKAYQDIENNSALSRTQKTMLQDGLNRDGSLPDSYK